MLSPNTSSRILRTLAAEQTDAAPWLRRITCELDFARQFATLFPDATDDWGARIEQAAALLDNLQAATGAGALIGAVQEAEEMLAPIGQAAKRYTIHCVGHGHIDMNWMWSWPETVSTTHDTFASVLSLMREYPELTYSQSQTSVYALMEKYHPEMFAEIVERVREGRWEVTASHWVEGDKNIASGESIARHLLYARRYVQEKFGISPDEQTLDWEPDTFGHANTVPAILARAGVKFYYACRLGGGFDHAMVGEPRPRLFWWQSPDGSRILVNRESTWYNSYVNIGDNIALPAVGFWKETRTTDWLNVYGFGNHGGGPTRIELDYYLEMRDWPIYPAVRFSTAKGWYETVADNLPENLPVLDHELNFEFTGCYTSQSLIKQANRFGENYCVEAETLAVLSGQDRNPALRDAWINVLFNQFHDILPGSGVRQTREHAMGLFQETAAITGGIKREAGKRIAAGINTAALLPDTPEADDERADLEAKTVNTPFVAGAGIGAMDSGISVATGGGRRFRPFVVYNPCAWNRSEAVTVSLYDTDFEPGRIVARDENGINHPTLSLGKGSDWGHQKIEVLFFAQDVPALGYKTYVLCEGAASSDAVPRVSAHAGEVFETPHLRVQMDRFGGGLRRADQSENVGVWNYVTERPRGMTSWAIGGDYKNELLPVRDHTVHGIARNEGNANPTGGSIAAIVRQHLPVPGTNSSVKLSYLIHGLSARVDVTASVDWREIGDAHRGIPGLAVRFPVPFAKENPVIRYETPFGSVERTDLTGQEVPTLRYAHVSDGGGKGFTLLNDCKYGHMWVDGALQLRVIRSSFDPDPLPEVVQETLRYSLIFHDGIVNPSELTRLGAAFNHPLIVFPANLQHADGPLARGFANVETPNVVLTALKQADSGSGFVVRLVEYDGRATDAVITLDPALIPGGASATVCDLLEQPGEGSATLDGNRLRVRVPAHGIVTVRVG